MPPDTSPDAAAIQADIFRGMRPAERLRLALEMSESMRNVALAGLRSRRPELNAKELSRELMRIMYGFVPPARSWKSYCRDWHPASNAHRCLDLLQQSRHGERLLYAALSP